MPTEASNSGTHRSPIQLRPTPAGAAVLAALALAVYAGLSARVAIGFFVPLVGLLVADSLLSRGILNRRPVTLRPVRTVAASPGRLTFNAEAPPGDHPLRLALAPMGLLDDEVKPVPLPADEQLVMLEMGDGLAAATTHVRYSTSASVFGLAWARQWTAQMTPLLHRAPAPAEVDIEVPQAVDELAQLRAYVPGDRFSRVSWPATARTGELHVRSAGIGLEEIVVVVNLGDKAGATVPGVYFRDASNGGLQVPMLVCQQVTEQASAVLAALLGQGHEIRLLTTNIDNSFHDRARDLAIENPRKHPRLNVSFTDDRTLLVDGRPLPLAVCDAVVTDHDDIIRRLALAESGPAISWHGGPHLEIGPDGARQLP